MSRWCLGVATILCRDSAPAFGTYCFTEPERTSSQCGCRGCSASPRSRRRCSRCTRVAAPPSQRRKVMVVMTPFKACRDACCRSTILSCSSHFVSRLCCPPSSLQESGLATALEWSLLDGGQLTPKVWLHRLCRSPASSCPAALCRHFLP